MLVAAYRSHLVTTYRPVGTDSTYTLTKMAKVAVEY